MLREMVLPALGLPKTEIAKALGVSRQTLYDILAEKQPVTPAMSVRLSAAFDTTAWWAGSSMRIRGCMRGAGTSP